jgi:hypothetical protein
MYNNQKFWVVTEANVGSNDTINMASYTFTDKNQAQSKLYRLWGYGSNPDSGETRQLLSAYMTEHRGNQIIMLESKVFDYRQPEPAPEVDEPEEES